MRTVRSVAAVAWRRAAILACAGLCALAWTCDLHGPDEVAATATGPYTIHVTWRDNSDEETGYRVQRSTDGRTWLTAGDVGPDETESVDTVPACETSYFYRVQMLTELGAIAASDAVEAESGRCPPCHDAALTCGGVVAGSTAGGRSTYDRYGCGGLWLPGPEVLVRFTLDADAVVSFDLTEDGCDLDLVVLGDDCYDPDGCVAHFTESGARRLDAGTYYLAVDGTAAEGCGFSLAAACRPPVSWTGEVIDEGEEFYGETSLVIDAGGADHATYYSFDTGLYYATDAGGSWEARLLVPAEPWHYAGWRNDLVVDAAGTVHVAYYDSEEKTVYYGRLAGDSWTAEPVATIDGPEGPLVGTSLVVDEAGVAYVAFESSMGDPLFADNAAGAWAIETIEDRPGNIENTGAPSLVLTADGMPVVAYAACDDPGRGTDLHVAARVGGVWEIETALAQVEGDEYVAGLPSLAIDAGGALHIAHVWSADADATDGSVCYTTDATGSWSTATLGSVPEVYAPVAIAAAGTGNVHILHGSGGRTGSPLSPASSSGTVLTWISPTIGDGQVRLCAGISAGETRARADRGRSARKETRR